MIMKVLIAVEDKHFAKKIAEFVEAHPWPEPVEFKVLHVVEPFPLGSSETSYATEKFVEEDRKLALKIVQVVSSQLKQSLPTANIEEVVMTGTANRVILEVADEWPAEMIVMGSHCCAALDRILLGSVPLSVASHAPCSVAIVRLSEEKPMQFEMCEEELPE